MISALSCRILSSNTEETWMCSEIHFCYFCNRSRGVTNVNRAFGERCTELWRAYDLNTNSHPQQIFSISQLKVTNWQEGHVPRGHLTRRRSLCKSLQVILSSHKLYPGMKSGSLKVACQEAGRHPLSCLRCSGTPNQVKVTCIQDLLL